MTLDPFYPVMPDAVWVARVVDAGARLVQLRLKEAAAEERVRQARAAREVCARAGATREELDAIAQACITLAV